VFTVAGITAGATSSVINYGEEGFTLLTPLYYGIAACVSGLFWGVFDRLAGEKAGKAIYVGACIVTAIIFANVLLLFGFSFSSYLTDIVFRDHLAVSGSAAVGALAWAIYQLRLREKS